jgi:TetR/AcrR family transcriptional repressor of mexCD-oprJ operon
MNQKNNELLKKLTLAITENPRGTTQDLAKAAGISRATFNRFCKSRENLILMISEQSELSLKEIINLAQTQVSDYPKAISKLIKIHFVNQEYLVFTCASHSSLNGEFWEKYLHALDDFFLRGQKANAFRLDLSSQMMTELFISVICGMIDAVYRGRIASSNIEEIMTVFLLHGIIEKNK